mmetsp:Transcript_28520/g.50641  ORF Transcript_28520/g.50641 Transcript_28520/m.50641 type:complete len:243 (-) Transcript_28520:1804-2532(-)
MVDVESVRSKVAVELRPFSDITKSLQHLVSQKHFDLLSEVLHSIYTAEASKDQARALVVKEHLKVIVPCMINEIWGGPQQTIEAGLSSKMKRRHQRKSPSPERTPSTRYLTEKTVTSPSANSRGQETERRRNSPSSALLRESSEHNFSKTLSGLSYQEAHSLSEFCNIKGAATFTRTKRPLTKGHQGSPGPAAYRADKGKLKVNSPRVVIPKGGKKGELFSTPYSPGPAAYYVMRHFISKPN